MAEYVFAGQSLKELAEFEKSVSLRDINKLEQGLADIAHNPYLPRRVTSFYDTSLPSYLYRVLNFLILY